MNTFTQRKISLLFAPFFFFEIGVSLGFLFTGNFQDHVTNPQAFFVTSILAWSLSALATKFYYYERNITYTKQLQRFLFSCLLFLPLFYTSAVTFLNTPFFPFVSVGFFFLAVFIAKAITLSMVFWMRKNFKVFQKNILVYDSKTGKQFVQDIKELKRTGYNPIICNKELFEEKAIEKLLDSVQKNKVSTIFIPFELMLKKSKEHIINFVWARNYRIRLIANYDFPITGRSSRFFGLTQVIKHSVSPLDTKARKALKRIFDIFFSSIVTLAFLSWFVPLLAIVIRMDSKGPTFFIQKRPGRDGKMFSCIKFRSMKVNKSTEKTASRNDSRITRIGKFIRKTSIDELPQFLNVLFGHMSVVGPRPNLTSQNDHYGEVFKDYAKRMYLKPGITGLAQVSGARGGIESDIEMKHRIKYDIFYTRHWSFALDIKIIIRTVLNIFRGEDNAY